VYQNPNITIGPEQSLLWFVDKEHADIAYVNQSSEGSITTADFGFYLNTPMPETSYWCMRYEEDEDGDYLV
jgi:hypothetical protein